MKKKEVCFWTIDGEQDCVWFKTKKEVFEYRKKCLKKYPERIKNPDCDCVVKYLYGAYEFGEYVPVRVVERAKEIDYVRH